MSSSIGLIISMLFVAITFLFGGDLLTLQAAFTSLENAADNIAYIVAYTADFSEESVHKLEIDFNVSVQPEEEYGGAYGDMVSFYVTGSVSNLFIMGNSYSMTVKRVTILGSYGTHEI